MRPFIPKEINDMYDVIMPYMVHTKENGWALRPDAPPEVVEANRKIDEFWEEAKRDTM